MCPRQKTCKGPRGSRKDREARGLGAGAAGGGTGAAFVWDLPASTQSEVVGDARCSPGRLCPSSQHGLLGAGWGAVRREGVEVGAGNPAGAGGESGGWLGGRQELGFRKGEHRSLSGSQVGRPQVTGIQEMVRDRSVSLGDTSTRVVFKATEPGEITTQGERQPEGGGPEAQGLSPAESEGAAAPHPTPPPTSSQAQSLGGHRRGLCTPWGPLAPPLYLRGTAPFSTLWSPPGCVSSAHTSHPQEARGTPSSLHEMKSRFPKK